MSLSSGNPETPYAGTSGFSGSDTSERRVRRDDADGTTAAGQQAALDVLAHLMGHGITVGEFARSHNVHHGKASAALSVLHKTGRIKRLAQVRKGAKVYVLPEWVGGRDTEEHGRPNKAAAALQERIDLIRATAQRWADDPCQNPTLTEPERYSYACRHCAAQTILHMIGDK